MVLDDSEQQQQSQLSAMDESINGYLPGSVLDYVSISRSVCEWYPLDAVPLNDEMWREEVESGR